MTSINNLPNYPGYYQLNSQSGGTGGQPNIAQPSLASALLAAGNGTSGDSSYNNSDAFLLDLSPAAKQYMESLKNGQASSPTLNGGGSFVLSSQQQQTITDILAKYKDAPFTQETSDQIQNDLQAAHLDPDTLSLQDKIKAFNPTDVLMQALNNPQSADSNTTNVPTDADEQAKAGNYMQQIVKQWKEIATNTDTQAQSGVTAIGSAGGA